MDDVSRKFRQRVIEHIELLASLSEQIKYQENVPIANVPAELICGFTDDLPHPKSEDFLTAFSQDEIESLTELYDMICIASEALSKIKRQTIQEFQKLPEWRAVVTFSKDLLLRLKNK